MVVINTNEVLQCWNQGAFYYSQGKYSEAIIQYEKALSVNTDYAMQGSLADAIRQCKIALGETEKGSSKYNDSQSRRRPHFEHNNTIAELSKTITTQSIDISAYKSMADSYYSQGKYRAALLVYEEALTIETDFAEQGKLADAMRRCKEAIRTKAMDTDECRYEHPSNSKDEIQSVDIIGL